MSALRECENCGRRTFYTKRSCLDCGRQTFRECEPGDGELLAITTVHVTPDGVREPNILGLASFGGANLVAQLADDALAVGDRVRLDGEVKLREANDDTVRGARIVAAD